MKTQQPIASEEEHRVLKFRPRTSVHPPGRRGELGKQAQPRQAQPEDDLARYDKEKAEIKVKAEGLEKIRDDSSKRSGKMGTSISYFTVAIATASILVTDNVPDFADIPNLALENWASR